MQMFVMLKILDENSKIKNLEVIWYFEEDDEDHYETGQFFEEKLERTKFIYVCLSEARNQNFLVA